MAKPKDIAFDFGKNWREFSGNTLDDSGFARHIEKVARNKVASQCIELYHKMPN